MNGGEIIAQVLRKQGVQYLFTLSGGHISPIFVEAQRQGIRIIDVRHEANAVFAADAISRLTGVPGVAAVTAGPGLTNSITAIKNAYLAQSPLILFGGATATLLRGRGALQDIDQVAMMKSNVKAAISVKKVRHLASAVENAFRIAQEGVPGPVFVECPVDLLYPESLVREWYGAKSNEVPPKNLQERILRWYINRHANNLFRGKDSITINDGVVPASFPSHSSSTLSTILSKIRSASKPLLLVGSGAMMNPQKANQLAEAVKKLGIPVYLSGMARGLLGKENPLQMRHKRKEAIKESDLIILAGVSNDFRLDYGNHIGHRPFISINRSREDLYKNKRPTVAALADPQELIIDLAKQFSGKYETWLSTLAKRDQEREKAIDNQANESVNGINPIKIFRQLEPMLGENAILVADGGDFVATSAYTLKPSAPLSWLDPGVFGTLGVGAGFAIAAKLVFPQKDVWIIYGDGSAGFSLMEYDTCVRHNLPIISLIGNDACWSQIARDQIEILGSDCAVRLAYSDYDLIAKSFGADGIKIETLSEFSDAVSQAQLKSRQGTPFVINAIIGKTEFRKGSISM